MMNQKLEHIETTETFRKLACSAWQHPHDPSTYITLTLDSDPIDQYVMTQRAAGYSSIDRLSVLCVLLGQVIETIPSFSYIYQRGHIKKRQGIRFFVPVMIFDKKPIDLYGVSLDDPQKKTIDKLADEIKTKTQQVCRNQDPQIRRVRRLLNHIPSWLIRPILALVYLLMYRWNVSFEWIGLPNDRFGQAIISPLYSLGIEHAYIPLYGHSNTSLSIGIGASFTSVKWNDQTKSAEPCEQFKLSITGDHRFIDGFHAGKAIKSIKKRVNKPENYLNISNTTEG